MVIRATIIILCELKWKNNPRLIHSFLNIATAFIFLLYRKWSYLFLHSFNVRDSSVGMHTISSSSMPSFFNSCVCCVPLLYCFGGCYDEEDGCCWSSFSYVCVVRGDISHNVSFLRLAECFLTIFSFQYFFEDICSSAAAMLLWFLLSLLLLFFVVTAAVCSSGLLMMWPASWVAELFLAQYVFVHMDVGSHWKIWWVGGCLSRL